MIRLLRLFVLVVLVVLAAGFAAADPWWRAVLTVELSF